MARGKYVQRRERQERLIAEILERENPQNKIDKIVLATKILMRKSPQARVDKIVAEVSR